MTSWCWRLGVGDNWSMLVTESRSWLHLWEVSDQNGQIGHQLFILVTNTFHLQHPSPTSIKPEIDRSSTFRNNSKLDETTDSISAKTDTFTSSFTTDLSTTRDQISATNSKLIRLDEQLEAIDEKVQTGLLTRNVSHKITFIKFRRCLLKIIRIITRTPYGFGLGTRVYHWFRPFYHHKKYYFW